MPVDLKKRVSSYMEKNVTGREIPTISDLFLFLVSKYKIIGVFSLATSVLAALLSLTQANYYDSMLKFKFEAGGPDTSMLGQYSSLANFAGISLGGGANSEAAFTKDVIESRFFYERYIDKKLSKFLLALKPFDSGSDPNLLSLDRSIFNDKLGEWNSDFLMSTPHDEILYQAHESFLSSFIYDRDNLSGLITIIARTSHPSLSKMILESIKAGLIERDRIERSMKASLIEKELRKSFENETAADVRSALGAAIVSHMTKNILTTSAQSSSMKIIEEPFVTKLKAGPNRVRIVLLAAAFSFVFIVGVFCFVFSFSNKDN